MPAKQAECSAIVNEVRIQVLQHEKPIIIARANPSGSDVTITQRGETITVPTHLLRDALHLLGV